MCNDVFFSIQKLVEAVKANKNLIVLNLESNFISGAMVRNVLGAINENQSILEFRAANQRPSILGNRVEMDIAKLVEKNNSLLRIVSRFKLKITEIVISTCREPELRQTHADIVQFSIQISFQGISFDVPDARMRVAQRLQQNCDNGNVCSPHVA